MAVNKGEKSRLLSNATTQQSLFQRKGDFFATWLSNGLTAMTQLTNQTENKHGKKRTSGNPH